MNFIKGDNKIMKIELPKIIDLKPIDKIAIQAHECHVKWRPDIFEHTDSIINEEELAKMIENKEIFVAKLDEKIVGYILLSSREGKKNGYKFRKELDIDAMGVDEAYRNQGIGFGLLEYVKKYAEENNYTDLRLTVNEENENAKHLYEKVGFKVKNIAYTLPLKNKNNV